MFRSVSIWESVVSRYLLLVVNLALSVSVFANYIFDYWFSSQESFSIQP